MKTGLEALGFKPVVERDLIGTPLAVVPKALFEVDIQSAKIEKALRHLGVLMRRDAGLLDDVLAILETK